MEIELSFLRFVGFLVLEIALVVASVAAVVPLGLLILNSGKIKAWYITMNGVLLTFVALFWLFLSVWVLTGVFPYLFVLVLLVSSIFSIFAADLLWLIIGDANAPFPGRIIWSTHEYSKIWPRTNATVQYFLASSILIYIIYIGIRYFGDSMPDEEWVKVVFQASLAWLLISGVAMLPQSFYTILSADILGATRTRIFINQLFGALPTILLFYLFLWTLSDVNYEQLTENYEIIFSPVFTGFMVGYIMLVVVLPFIIGHYRSMHLLAALMAEKNLLLDNFMKAIESPTISLVEKNLAEFSNTLDAKLDEWNTDHIVHIANEVLESDNSPENIPIKIGFNDSQNRDARFIHISSLMEIEKRLGELLTSLDEDNSDESKRQGCNIVAAGLKRMREKEYLSNSTASVWVIGVVSSAAGTIFSPLWTTFASYLQGLMGITTP